MVFIRRSSILSESSRTQLSKYLPSVGMERDRWGSVIPRCALKAGRVYLAQRPMVRPIKSLKTVPDVLRNTTFPEVADQWAFLPRAATTLTADAGRGPRDGISRIGAETMLRRT